MPGASGFFPTDFITMPFGLGGMSWSLNLPQPFGTGAWLLIAQSFQLFYRSRLPFPATLSGGRL
jgi:hypothetical protein